MVSFLLMFRLIGFFLLCIFAGASLSECVQLRFHCDLPPRNGHQGKKRKKKKGKKKKALHTFDGCKPNFFLRRLLQVVALGFCFGKQTYLQSSWNVLDGLLVFVSLVDILFSLAYSGGNRILGILRVLRLLRTLRPLRYGSLRVQLSRLELGV